MNHRSNLRLMYPVQQIYPCLYENIWKGRDLQRKMRLHEWRYIIFIFLTSFMTYHRVCVTMIIQWIPHVEESLLTLPEHMSTLSVVSGVCVARCLVFCVMFCRSLFVPFVVAMVTIVLYVLRFTASLLSSTFLDRKTDQYS